MMKNKLQLFFIIGVFALLISCNNENTGNSSNSYYSEYSDDSNDDADKGIEDGTYSATVEYYNPNTDYSATYTLDVEVEDGEVTIIYFPNDGYLDDDHIYPEELDEDGYVEISGEDGQTYDIQIDL